MILIEIEDWRGSLGSGERDWREWELIVGVAMCLIACDLIGGVDCRYIRYMVNACWE